MAISMLNLKTGCMLDMGTVDYEDSTLLYKEISKLPRYCDTGAAGFYVLFDYSDLAECNEFLQSDCEAVEALTVKYTARANDRKAHPNKVDACQDCKDEWDGRDGREEFSGIWDVDEQDYFCECCQGLVT